MRKYCLTLLFPSFLIFLSMRMRAANGRAVTQIIRIGAPKRMHHFKCSTEYHSMSVSILTRLTPLSISIHLKILRPS